MTLTNSKMQKLELRLENLYDLIQGSDPDTDWYETICLRISDVKSEIAEEVEKINKSILKEVEYGEN